jgi:hypothetical protein
MLLTIVDVMLAVIAGVILVVFSGAFISSIGAATFGAKCYFAFAEYNVVNNFLFPVTYFIQPILGTNPFVNSPQASSQVQSACIQPSNVNGQAVSSVSAQIYAKAASCFNLFQGANANAGDEILKSSSVNGVFECYSGTIYTSGLINYSKIIDYINKNYPNNGNAMQMVFITNGSGGTARYSEPSSSVLNGSTYIIEYFGYPSKSPPTGAYCSLSFQSQCGYVSQFQQPAAGQTCSYQNQTSQAAYNTVSSLSNGNAGLQTQGTIGVCGDYFVHFCGTLLNSMMLSQDRVFVCVTNSTSR